MFHVLKSDLADTSDRVVSKHATLREADIACRQYNREALSGGGDPRRTPLYFVLGSNPKRSNPAHHFNLGHSDIQEGTPPHWTPPRCRVIHWRNRADVEG